MILSKQDYYEYLEADRISLGRKSKSPKFSDTIWKYQIVLRKCEYYTNCKHGIFAKLMNCWYKYKKFKYERMCGFSIPINVIDKGLAIVHVGPVIISRYARIGKNFRVHVGVNIGADARNEKDAPVIGDNVYVAPGVKIFGKIHIADNIAIGANAVVNKDFLTEGISLGGIPAKKISDRGSQGIIRR